MITFALEISDVRLVYFLFNSLNLKTAQMQLLELGFTKVMAGVAWIFQTAVLIYSESVVSAFTTSNGKSLHFD